MTTRVFVRMLLLSLVLALGEATLALVAGDNLARAALAGCGSFVRTGSFLILVITVTARPGLPVSAPRGRIGSDP
jgi:hypothetical protein